VATILIFLRTNWTN